MKLQSGSCACGGMIHDNGFGILIWRNGWGRGGAVKPCYEIQYQISELDPSLSLPILHIGIRSLCSIIRYSGSLRPESQAGTLYGSERARERVRSVWGMWLGTGSEKHEGWVSLDMVGAGERVRVKSERQSARASAFIVIF